MPAKSRWYRITYSPAHARTASRVAACEDCAAGTDGAAREIATKLRQRRAVIVGATDNRPLRTARGQDRIRATMKKGRRRGCPDLRLCLAIGWLAACVAGGALPPGRCAAR